MGFMRKAASAALLLAAVLPSSGHAYYSDDVARSSRRLDERISDARARCLGESYDSPRITFDNPRGIWVELYDASTASRATMLIYDPLTHGLGGLVQGGIDAVLGGGDAFAATAKLKILGSEAREFARRRGMNRLDALCLASCIVNEMIEGTEEIPHMLSLDLALADGVGDCKIYAEAMDVLAQRMGIPLHLATSWEHAFNRVSYQGKSYYVDATRWNGSSCNFVPVDFYD